MDDFICAPSMLKLAFNILPICPAVILTGVRCLLSSSGEGDYAREFNSTRPYVDRDMPNSRLLWLWHRLKSAALVGRHISTTRGRGWELR